MTLALNHRMSARVFALIAVTVSTAAIAQIRLPSQPRVALESVSGSQPLRDGIAIQAGPATLRITALRDDILRVRIAPGSTLPEDASWAVLPGLAQ